MALWAIGDFHLSLGIGKTMDKFGDLWKNHPEKIRKAFKKRVKPTDTVVITGDHSWGRNTAECMPDFEFIASLPGRKIMIRGNHDLFWDAKRTDRLNKGILGDRFFFLQNNFASYKDYALVGTKGYCFEGRDTLEHFIKIRDREIERLRVSFEAAREAGYEKFIMFMHYPPTSIGENSSLFTKMAEEYGAEQVVYSHCHGIEHFYDSFQGNVNGIEYRLVSSDYLKFKPVKILD